MAIGVSSGLVGTADPLANELKIDMRDKIAQLDPETSQFTTMLMHPKLEGERAKSFKVEWMSDQLLPRVLGLSATIAANLTTIPHVAGESVYLRPGDLIRVASTGEMLRVTATSDADSSEVVRSIGSVAAATAASTAKLVVISVSNEQGATLPLRLITDRVADYNYTQIHRSSYGFTETAMATEWYGGPLETKERKKKAIEHKWGLELTNFFGAREYISSGTKPRHTTGGLIEFITTNVTSVAGALDKAILQDFLRTGLEYGNKGMKVLFCSPLIAQVLGEFMQDNWIRTAPDTKVWGAVVDFVISSAWGARVPVVVKGDWKRMGEGTAGQYGSMAFLVDMGNVQYAPLRDTVLKPNRQANDADERSAEYITECSLKVEREETHSILKNVSG
jgi:hypothetical protein